MRKRPVEEVTYIGNVVPLEKSELAQFYWETDFKTTEIAIAFGFSGSINMLAREAGPAYLPRNKCTCCGLRVKVYSRTDALDRLRNMQNWSIHAGHCARWASPFICLRCKERLQAEDMAPRQAEYELQREREKELRFMPYAEYLRTPEWQITRQDALKRAGFKCQTCSAGGELHVHHRTYIRRGVERPSDLIALCADCHKIFHENGKLAENGRAA